MKRATLEKLQVAARDGQCRLFYFDEAGFCGSPPVQRSWSPRGLPHAIEPNHHCRRNVMGALNFGENSFVHTASARTVKGPDVEGFLDELICQGDARPTVIVLDNASIHHGIDPATRERWLIEQGNYSGVLEQRHVGNQQTGHTLFLALRCLGVVPQAREVLCKCHDALTLLLVELGTR
uniref:transposase n=1 Tax=Paraburkholderia mimosarum TaxID=312026 RepID=UPI0012B50F2B